MADNNDRSTTDILQEMASRAKQIILLNALEQVIQAAKVKAMADACIRSCAPRTETEGVAVRESVNLYDKAFI